MLATLRLLQIKLQIFTVMVLEAEYEDVHKKI